MEAQEAITKIQEAKEHAKKRNFTQSVDFVINLKNLDFKKPEEQVDFYVQVPNSLGKKVLVCALAGPELIDEAKNVCDHAIHQKDFTELSKEEVKELAKTYDYFIAQGNIMADVAKTFGRVLGPRGKMPDPKAGCVVAPKTNLQPIHDRLQRLVRVQAKKDPVIHLLLGREDQDEQELADNLATIYNQLRFNLPLEENNIKDALVKLTMGKPVVL